MNRCTKCGVLKSEEEFYRNHKWLSGSCKECSRKAQRARYRTDPEGFAAREKVRSKIRYESRRALWDALLQHLYCKDCGQNSSLENGHWTVDFHHRNPDDYSFRVSEGFVNRNLILVAEEIRKCDVLCRKCHKIRHAKMNKLIQEAQCQ
jgi:uncharacterized ubiquitin-like protein YukD